VRVLYFSHGSSIHDYHFLQGLADSEHEIFVLSLESRVPTALGYPLPQKVRHVQWNAETAQGISPEKCQLLVPEFKRVLDRVRPDLVHAGPVQTCGLVAAMSGFHPFLLMSWGRDILMDANRNAFSEWCTRFALRSSDLLLCDSGAVVEAARRWISYPEGRIIRFPWGINVETFLSSPPPRTPLREQLGWLDAFIVLSTRSWEPIYNIGTLIEAFRLAHSRRPNVRLLMLGSGSQAEEVRHFVLRHRLSEVVHLAGRIEHESILQYYDCADVYVSCSLTDGSSVSLLEAMARGLPPVVSDIPGNREWITPGENGWLVPARSTSLFAGAILQAADLSLVVRDRIAERNRQIVRERADWRKNFDRLLKAYESIEGETA